MYSSVDDVRNALAPGGSASDTGTAAAVEDNQIQDAIAEADGIISVHIASRYEIPLDMTATPPGVVAVSPVRWWSRTIAAYLITLTYKRGKDVPEDEPARLRYDEVMKMLEGISKGDISLPFPASPDLPTNVSGDVFIFNMYEGNLFAPADFRLGHSYPIDGWPRWGFDYGG